MAEEEEGQEEELSENETAELEKLLSDSEGEETAEGAEGSAETAPKGIVQRLKSDKKFLVIAVAGLLLLTSAGGGAYWYFFVQAPGLEEKAKLDETEVTDPEEDSLLDVDKAQVYSLEPFFLALEQDGQETDRFIKVVPHLLLSNSALGEEVDKILPQIRRGIYNILRRTDPNDFKRNQVKAEEKIKSQIITDSNSNLLSGTGTIIDVFYTQFMIK
jgi:flagellar basal body-associated protein FliL